MTFCYHAAAGKVYSTRSQRHDEQTREDEEKDLGEKKLDVCKSKRIRISEDLFQRWKDLKRIRKARSDEELVAYLLDLATATDLSDSPRYGKRRTTVTSLSFISLHSFRHHVSLFYYKLHVVTHFFYTRILYYANYIPDRHAYNFRGIAPLTLGACTRGTVVVLCVSLSVTILAATYLIYTSKVRGHRILYGIFKILIVWLLLKMLHSKVLASFAEHDCLLTS